MAILFAQATMSLAGSLTMNQKWRLVKLSLSRLLMPLMQLKMKKPIMRKKLAIEIMVKHTKIFLTILSLFKKKFKKLKNLVRLNMFKKLKNHVKWNMLKKLKNHALLLSQNHLNQKTSICMISSQSLK